MKKHLFTFPVAALALVVLFSGCGKNTKSELNFDYLAVQMSKGESWSIIDKDGEEVVKEEYPADARLSYIHDGAYWVYAHEKYQLYNLDNPKKPVIDEEFTAATHFNAGVAVVGNPNQPIRIIDTKGNTVAQLSKDIKRCYTFNREGYARIRNINNQEGLIDNKGNIVIAPSYFDLKTPNEGLTIAQKESGDKKALILNMKGEKQGEINLEKYYLLNSCFSDGKICVRNEDDHEAPTVVLDTKGQKLFELKKAKEGYSGASFFGGYVTFSTGEAVGVADEKGDVIIRPKYETMINFSNGTFVARKDDKWGVVNTDDETVIDFDYDDWDIMMGDNYILKDGSTWSLMEKDGKEIISFVSISRYADSYVEYVDVSGITTAVYNFISEYEQAFTPAQMAQKLSLSLDDHHYQSYINTEFDADDKAKVELKMRYSNYVAEEKTHEEQVNDGWFTISRTVSDGWSWSTEIPDRMTGTITLSDESINLKDFYKALVAKFAEGRTKVSDNTFTKNIKVGGSTVECRTTLEQNYSNVGIQIMFRQ